MSLGARHCGLRWAQWLVSVQERDGAFLDAGGKPVFATRAALRGLASVKAELPEVQTSIAAAERYLQSASAGDRPSSHAGQSRVELWCTHDLAWEIDLRLEQGLRSEAEQLLAAADARQRRDGSVPALPGARWVSSTALAHLAVCWYKSGRRHRADRAMKYLRRRQNASGAFYGSWGRGTACHARRETTWTVKHYLDAAQLQVAAAFDAQAEGFPDAIDPSDGRVQAVRRWISRLPCTARVADVGCGTGRFLRHVAAWFPQVSLIGVDISPAMLARLPQGVAAVPGSLLRVPLPDAALDGAYAVESLEHALMPELAVQELCRLVRPGGGVLVIDKHRARQALSEHEPWEQWFTPDELLRWLSAWCDDVQIEPVAHLEGRPGRDLFLAATGRRRQAGVPPL